MKTVHANGAAIPALGFGTWELRDDTCSHLVCEALKMGYRHIDTAQGYENEAEVGEGVRASGVPREEIFITTKVRAMNLRAGVLERSVKESVERLGTYADLLLIHWPNPDVPIAETLAAMARVKREGLIRHIGLSNFTVRLIEEAVAASEEPIVTNQVEYHPYLDQTKVLAACRRHGMSLTAYRPILRGTAGEDPVIADVARRNGITPVQAVLAWLLAQDGVIAIPRTSKVERARENLAAADIRLPQADLDRIAELTRANRRFVSPATAPAWD